MRRLRRIIIYLAIALAAIIIVAGIIVNSGILSGRIGSTIAGKISAATGRPTTIGSVTATLGGTVTVHDLVIKNPDGSAFATLPEAIVRIGGRGVIPRSPSQLGQIKEIILRNPTIRLVRQKNGKWALPSTGAKRAPGQPVAMPGKITLTGGTIDVVDEVRGATTRLLNVTAHATGTNSGLLDFVTTANGEKNAFDAMRAQGRYDSARGGVRVTLHVTNVSAVYAFNRLPVVRGISVARGRADVDGDLTIQPLPDGRAAWIPNLSIRPHAAEISFPWLRRPVTDLTGSFKLVGLDLTIQQARARVAGAPLGMMGTVTNLRKPTVRLDFTVPSVGMSQVKQLIPAATLPAGLSLPTPARVQAQARGTVPNIAISGQARVPTAIFGCVPWHDLVAQFGYTRGHLDITHVRGHGSPRQLNADVHVALIPGRPQTRADVVMRGVPMVVLARCVPELRNAPVGGTATIRLHLQVDHATGVSGTFTARGARYGRFQLGSVSADFDLVGPLVRLRQGTLAGPSATGTFSGTFVRGGRYEVTADLTALNLETLGVPALAEVTHGLVRVAGSMGEHRTTGHADLTLAPPPGVPARTASADFAFTAREAVLAPLILRTDSSEITGRLAVSNWQRGARGTLAGTLHLTNVPIKEWFPQYTAVLPPSYASGTVDLSGSLVSPRVTLNLSLASVSTAVVGAGHGTLRATYQGGELRVQEFTFRSPTTTISATGGFSPRTGLQVALHGTPIDLAAFNAYTGPALGLSLSGMVTVTATTSGPVGNPFVTFTATAPELTINDEPFQGLVAAGTFRNGLVTLQTFAIRQGEGSITASNGTANLLSRRLDFAAKLTNLDVRRFMFIADQTVWRRYFLYATASEAERARLFRMPPIPASTAYASIPRPLGGRLSADLSLTGTFSASQLAVNNLFIRHFAYGGEERAAAARQTPAQETQEREIEQISGSLGLALQGTRLHQVTLANITATAVNPPPEGVATIATPTAPAVAAAGVPPPASVAAAPAAAPPAAAAAPAPASEGEAVALVNGGIVGNAMTLDIEVNNLDLRLLKPWFPQLGGLVGVATVSAEVSGPVDDPAVHGTAYVLRPGWQGLRFEVAQIPSAEWRNDVLTIDSLRIVNHGMEATGTITWPLPAPFQTAPSRATVPPSGEFHVTHGHFAPLPDMQPAEFDADFDLVPTGRLMIRRVVSSSTGEVVEPGIRGTLGGGPFTAQGEVDFPAFRLDQLGQARYNVTVDLGEKAHGRVQPAGVIIGSWMNVKLQGQLRVVSGRREVDGRMVTGPVLETAPGQPLLVSNGFVGVPPATQVFAPPGGLPITPTADITVLTGPNLDFRYGAIRAQVIPGGPPANPTSGYLHIGGLLTANDSTLAGRFDAAAGRLNFPNGAMDLRYANAVVTKAADQPLRIILNAEAEGQVGDYYVVLNPSGQVFPFPTAGGGTFSLGARSIPYLDEPFILALLLGPTISPALGTESQAAQLLATPWASPAYAGTITGLAVPIVPGGVALNYEFMGQVSLRLRQRLFGRLSADYLAPVSGPTETRRLALTYEVTPRWSVGWSVNALDQTRWQVQSYFAF